MTSKVALLVAPRALPRRARITSWVLGVALALVFALQGVMKLIGTSLEIEAFRRWGYPDWFRIVVGLVEVALVPLVALPRTRLVGAIGIMGVMIGAAVTLVRSDEAIGLPVPLTVFVLAALLAWIHRPRADVT